MLNIWHLTMNCNQYRLDKSFGRFNLSVANFLNLTCGLYRKLSTLALNNSSVNMKIPCIMKNLYTIAVMLVLTFTTNTANSQWINSLTILPANPTVNDTITVLADCSFFAGGCSEHTQTQTIIGNSIYASALHCVGVLTVICNYTDTFKIDPLPAGNYTFYLQVDAGQGPSPCTPGIVAGQNDSISFTVFPFTGLQEQLAQDLISIIPNPGTKEIKISGVNTGNYPLTVTIMSADGKIFQKATVQHPDELINITSLPDALYQLLVNDVNNSSAIIPFVKTGK